MATERELNILIKAKDMASQVLSKYGDQFDQIGKAMLGVGAAGVAGLGVAVKTAADFESQMSKVKAISGATDSDFKKMTQTAMDLGATTTKSASEVAKGMENMAAMGFNANEIMGAMPGVIAAAEASGADMAQTTDVMSAALNMFGLKATDASRVADILAKTANISAADITDMQYALKYAGPPANSLGVSLEELSASIGLMTNAGMKGEQAGTTLRGALLGLLDPSEENSKMMNKMGIEITDAKGNFVGLSKLIGNLQGSMEGMTDTQKAATLASLVGKEAVSGMLTLMEAGPETISKMTKELENSAGSSKEASAIMTDNLNGAVEQMGGAFESASIIIGNQLIPYIRAAAEAIGNMVTWFNNLSPSTQALITKIMVLGTIFSLLAGGILVLIPMLPAIGAAMAALFGPVGLVIALIAALYAAFITNFGGIRDYVMSWVEAIKTAFSYLTGGMNEVTLKGSKMGMDLESILGSKAYSLVQIFLTLKNGILGAFEQLQTVITPLVTQFGVFLVTFWTTYGAQVIATVQYLWTTIQNIVSTVFGFIVMIIQQYGPQILAIVTGAFTSIWNVISVIMVMVQALINLVWTGISNLIQQHGQSIVSHTVAAFQGIKNAIDVASKLITQIIQWAWPYIQQIIQIVLNQVIPWAIKMFNQIAAFVGDVMPKIVKVIQWAWQSVIQPLLTGVMNFLVPFLKNAWSGISTLISGVMNVIMGVIKTVLSIITGDWSGAWDGIKQTVSGAISVIGGVVSTIGTILAAPFKLALGVIQGLASSFFNVGVDIIRGLINGIKSMVGGIVSSIKDAVGGAVKAAKSALGIHSPSRVFMEIGNFTTEGFANGILSAADMAKKASEKMAQGAITPVQSLDMSPAGLTGKAPGSAAASNGSGAGQTTVVLQFNEGSVNLPGVKNGQEFVQTLQGFALRQAFKSQ